MATFQDTLNKELQKRGLQNAEDTSAPVKKKKPFSADFFLAFISGFLKVLIPALLILGGVFAYLWVNKEKTVTQILSQIPSKTAIVTKGNDSVFNEETGQPVLRMQASEDLQKQEEDIKGTPVAASGLSAAPIVGLYEETDKGKIPVRRAEDGLTPFQAYKKPFEASGDKPRLSFVITELGLNAQQTQKIIQSLPDTVTLAFSPYAPSIRSLIEAARADGHESWLMLPMQTKNFPLVDSGPYALLLDSSVPQTLDRLGTILSQADGYAGLMTTPEHAFTVEEVKTNKAFEDIFKRGLAIVESNPDGSGFLSDYAGSKDYPYAQNHIWLDERLLPLSMNQQLRRATEKSLTDGHAVVMLRPYPVSLDSLTRFLQSKAADDFAIAPLSAQIKTE